MTVFNNKPIAVLISNYCIPTPIQLNIESLSEHESKCVLCTYVYGVLQMFISSCYIAHLRYPDVRIQDDSILLHGKTLQFNKNTIHAILHSQASRAFTTKRTCRNATYSGRRVHYLAHLDSASPWE